MTAPQYIEEWFGEASQQVLVDLYEKVAHRGGAVIEVGSWEGRSTVALANAAWPTVVSAVDTWEGSPGEVSAKLAAERDIYATFQANIAAGTKGNVCPFRMGWRQYFADRPNQLIRFLFIDAEHSYQEVFDNVTVALPRMVKGGIICGDDVHHPPIQEALLDLFDPSQVNTRATVWWVTT